MRNITLLFTALILSLFVSPSFGVNYSTNTTGSTWDNAAHWNGGGYPDDNTDDANISYNMNYGSNGGPNLNLTIDELTVNDITLVIWGTLRVNSLNLNNNAGTIIVNGTLIIYGNVQNTGLSNIIINTGASVTVGGKFDMYNGCDALVNGSLTVTGILNGQEAGTAITGTGTVKAGGYAGAGSLFGISPMSSLTGGNTYPIITPIELTYFKAFANKTSVTLNWQTATELNNDYFTLQRSADGVNYEVIGTVLGAGTSMAAINYSYSDNNPLNGVSYYRLKQTDYDGQFEVFSPVSVSYLNESEIKIGSTPSTKEITINMGGEMGLSTAKIYNVIGVLMKTIELTDTYTTINVNNIPKGTYILVVSDNKTQVTKKIMVQ